MKYTQYTEEEFIQDEYFQKWVLNPDEMTMNFWENWISEHREKKEIIESAANFLRLMHFDDSEELSEKDFDTMWQNIVQKRNDSENSNSLAHLVSGFSWKRLLKVAAVFIGIIVTSYATYRYASINPKEEIQLITDSEIILKLEDGTVQIIDETSSEIITNAKGKKVVSQEQDRLIYEEEVAATQKLVKYNELIIPYGKKFELKLSDGSQVVLNSGSKLRYPVAFANGQPRNVYLDGEAYFTVEKDKTRPFTVITDQMNTRVYGTKFNVSSYKNENNTSTVLIEGSVGVYEANNDEGAKAINITPGHRAILENGTIAVDQVDVSKYIAWAEGQLFFVDDEFEVIIKELERHFNVVIDNQVLQLNTKRYTGTFTNEPIDQILRVFQEHTPFDFKVNGDATITISEKNNQNPTI